MIVLVIEDDPNKYQHLIDFLNSTFTSIEIDTKVSYQSGLRAILDQKYDLIFLDMSLPTYDISLPEEPGGPFRDFAGEEILSEMAELQIKQNVIIITQFESFGENESFITLGELKSKFESNFPEIYLGAIYYNAFETNWKNELLNIINSLETEAVI